MDDNNKMYVLFLDRLNISTNYCYLMTFESVSEKVQ